MIQPKQSRILALFMTVLAFVMLESCKPSAVSSSSTTATGSYSEDLQAYRPKFEVKEERATKEAEPIKKEYPVPTNDISAHLDLVFDTLASHNRKVKYVDGFTVLVYAGTNRELAMQAKNDAGKLAPQHRPDIHFVQPAYRVKVGRFVDRLEAQKVYATLRSEFKNAIIIPEKVAIN